MVRFLPFLVLIPTVACLCTPSPPPLPTAPICTNTQSDYFLFNSRGNLCTTVRHVDIVPISEANGKLTLANREQDGPFLCLGTAETHNWGNLPLLLELRKEECFGLENWEGWWAKVQGWSFKQQNFPTQVWGDQEYSYHQSVSSFPLLFPTGVIPVTHLARFYVSVKADDLVGGWGPEVPWP